MTSQRTSAISLLLAAGLTACTGCWSAPGKPSPDSAEQRPDQVMDSAKLYSEYCAACHGDRGHYGAAISLANPVYLALASESTIEHVIAKGVPGTLMPAFAQSNGGMLTDQQVSALAKGMIANWSNPGALNGQTPPPYASHLSADASRGQATFATHCAQCHGADATGNATSSNKLGSLVDPAYLALISQQGLRSNIIAGKSEQGMPDWRGNASGIAGSQPLTDQEVTNIVAWLESHRTAAPGQPHAAPK